jgi:hypothetical protein
LGSSGQRDKSPLPEKPVLNNEEKAVLNFTKYIGLYLIVFGGLLAMFAPALGLSRPMVLILSLLAVVLGAIHGVKAYRKTKN